MYNRVVNSVLSECLAPLFARSSAGTVVIINEDLLRSKFSLPLIISQFSTSSNFEIPYHYKSNIQSIINNFICLNQFSYFRFHYDNTMQHKYTLSAIENGWDGWAHTTPYITEREDREN